MKTSHYVIGSLLAAGLLFIAPACASTYGSRSDHGRDYRSDSQRRAFASGQSEGLKNGRSDAEKGHRFEYEQHDAYRDADKGYNRRDGDRKARESFRKGSCWVPMREQQRDLAADQTAIVPTSLTAWPSDARQRPPLIQRGE
jgi:hypothetical protein